MKTTYLALGSNLGDRKEHLEQALKLIHSSGVEVMRMSSVYETAPMYRTDQGWFLNMVIEGQTDLFPLQLLKRLQRIESQLGRRRGLANGPRTIDIDILFYGQFVVDSGPLVIPHPRLQERRFVLVPLAEIAPDLRHPVLRNSVRRLLDSAPEAGIKKSEVQIQHPGELPPSAFLMDPMNPF